jgi:hypothetical protein
MPFPFVYPLQPLCAPLLPCVPPYYCARPLITMRAPSTLVRAPSQACIPPSAGLHPRPTSEYAPLQVCAPSLQPCMPPPQACVPSALTCGRSTSAGMRALPSGVRALAFRRAHPPHPRTRPFADVRAFPTPIHVLPSIVRVIATTVHTHPCARLLVYNLRPHGWWQVKVYKGRGPSYPHFITLGFVSWDSFVGSLYEAVGIVQHFRF